MNTLKKVRPLYYISTASILYIREDIYNNSKKSDSKNTKEYTYKEIKSHNKEGDVWVTYKNGVYDVSNFLNNHPGGKDKLLLAAGTSIEPYWKIYKQHDTEYIKHTILEPMKIGTIKDYVPNDIDNDNITDNYLDEPIRDNNLLFHSVKPCNAETTVSQITDNWLTPNHLWYVRNHSPVPKVDIEHYTLEIQNSNQSYKLCYDDLLTLPKTEVTSTIQCGGNRRSEYNTNGEKTSGTPWGCGSISTAKWSGVLLQDIIHHLKIDTQNSSIKHVHFIGYDDVQASIPIEKVLNNYGDVLLAYQMNDETLPPDHGFPLRVIVPGYVGIRNIKWIKKIAFFEEEIDGPWQRGISYKGLPHYIKDANNIDISQIASIYETPIQSCVTAIENNNTIKGFAWSGGGRNIIRVDVSIDDGQTWQMAELQEGSEQPFNQAWAWTFWELKLNNTDKINKVMCKAVDNSYNVQSEDTNYLWNIRGLLNNSLHKYTN